MAFFERFFLIFFSSISLFILSACGMISNESSSNRVVVDDSGQSVSLPAHPSRIISLTYGTDEILLDLVEEDRVIGISKYSGNPDISFLPAESAERIPHRVGNDVEQIMALKPDLVISSTAMPADVIHVLRSSGVPVYVSLVASNWDEMEKKVMGVARAVNEEEKGHAMVSSMRQKREDLEKKLSEIPKDQERTALGLSFRGILGKKGTLFSEVLAMAHVKDGAARYDVPKGTNAYLSLEILPEINPDVILMPVWKVKSGDDETAFARKIMENPAYRDVKAVKNGRLVPFPEKYKYVMSQHVTDAVEASARAVYPELFDKDSH